MKELSKIKYLYKIYPSEDKKIHCEKHAVVYINSEYCYFKEVRKSKLTQICTSLIKEVFNNASDLEIHLSRFTSSYIGNNYFLTVNNFDSENVTNAVFIGTKEKQKEKLEKEINRKKLTIERERNEIDKKLKMLKNLEEEVCLLKKEG